MYRLRNIITKKKQKTLYCIVFARQRTCVLFSRSAPDYFPIFAGKDQNGRVRVNSGRRIGQTGGGQGRRTEPVVVVVKNKINNTPEVHK